MNARDVWLCTEDFPPRLGGISRWSGNTARALAENGLDVTVFVRKRAEPAEGLRVLPVRGHDFPRFRRFHFARAVARLLREEGEPGRLVASTWHVAEGLLGFGVPVTTAAHGMEILRKPRDIIAGGGGLQAALLGLASRRKRVLERSDRIVCASGYTAGAVKALAPGANVRQGLNGVDTVLFSAEGPVREREHDLQLVSVGRLVPRKNFPAVLDLLEALLDRGADAGLWVVGSGPGKQGLVERAERFPGRTAFFENIPDRDLATMYRSADLFVSPCLSDPVSGDVEGFGLTFVEASACGLPVAGVSEGGVVDAVEHGVSGILAPRDEFVARTCELALDRAKLRRLGEQGMERALRCFDIRKVVLNLL